MLVLASADHHFCERVRFEECVRVHRWIVELARTEKPDVYLSGGDIYERASSPLEREAAGEHLTCMAEICPVVISKGNHDRPLDVKFMRRLRTRHPIIVEERAGVHLVAGAAIATIAWPEPAYLTAKAESQEQASADLRLALTNILRALGSELSEHDGPRILLGHMMVDGSITSTGQPLLGQPINVSLSDLGLVRAQLGIIGHIHKAQRFDVFTGPHWYPGSPFRTSFGQSEKKLVLLAEFNGKHAGYSLDHVQEIETPATPMVDLEADWRDGALERTGDNVSGAEVRLRFRVPNEHRDAARAAAEALRDKLLAEGALSVKVEQEITVETRARMPTVVAATRPAEKLEAFWAAKGYLPGERREPLLAKFAQLEAKDVA